MVFRAHKSITILASLVLVLTIVSPVAASGWGWAKLQPKTTSSNWLYGPGIPSPGPQWNDPKTCGAYGSTSAMLNYGSYRSGETAVWTKGITIVYNNNWGQTASKLMTTARYVSLRNYVTGEWTDFFTSAAPTPGYGTVVVAPGKSVSISYNVGKFYPVGPKATTDYWNKNFKLSYTYQIGGSSCVMTDSLLIHT